MKSKNKSNENEDEKQSSSSEENIESNYKPKTNQMFLDIEEKPEIVIEKILIDIFNKYITPGNFDVDFLKIQMHQNKIKLLCTKQEKSKIIYILLYKIRSLINKYREKLFELPNIIKLREKIYQKYYKRSQSEKKITSKNYFNYYLERVDLNTSYPRLKKFNYYHITKNLFCELKNIKYCLRKSAPIIEKIFELPLSKFEKFSIWECEKEDYLKILIHDDFIWNRINKKYGNPFFNDIISEITEDDDKNLTSMTERIEYFKYKKVNIDYMLKISEIGSSLDTRFPEDAKPIYSLRDELYQSIISEDKDMRQSYEEVDIEEYTNSEEQNNDEINNIKEITIYKALKKRINQTKSGGINKSILTSKTISTINSLNDDDNLIYKVPDLQSLLKNKDINNKDSSKNKNIEIKNINKKKKKETKKKNIIKKETTKSKKSVKIDKSEIPNDLDDLVKYIVNDDKTETQKKKKKNKKKKKKKSELKEDKKEEQDKGDIKKDDRDEVEETKKDLAKNSINRYKIHKIKFKYRPKWLNKITKLNS